MTRQKMMDLPPGLEKTRQRFEHWRRTRKTRSRIPGPLWNAAARMARRYGINQTAQALRVDYYSLKKRAENEASSASETNRDAMPTFLELATPATSSTCECILELEDVTGSKMRVELKNVETPDLAALTRSFRGIES
jgi:hypothetical protein